MFEKVNPAHPDKLADRIAGALVDLAYLKNAHPSFPVNPRDTLFPVAEDAARFLAQPTDSETENPRIAVEVLLGHGRCYVVAETSVGISYGDVYATVHRILGDRAKGFELQYTMHEQAAPLAKNQNGAIRCGDNGVFYGHPVTGEQRRLTDMAGKVYDIFGTDGKYLLGEDGLTVCQSEGKQISASDSKFTDMFEDVYDVKINPLGNWRGGYYVDSGATNRKLGSDMGLGAAGGGGLHGKDLSKPDVAVNVYAFILAQERGEPVKLSCSIGDEEIGGVPYEEIVNIARRYIASVGGFERFAEWGLIRPTVEASKSGEAEK